MHYIRLSIVLAFIFLVLSAESSCGTYQSGSSYQTMAYDDAVSAGIPPQLFVNQINEESHFNPSAISPVGAEGIAQLMPSTAVAWGVDPYDVSSSLNAAAQHMAWYLNKYGDYRKALVCYNAGCGRLDWAIQHCKYYYYCLPSETQRYIDIIMG